MVTNQTLIDDFLSRDPNERNLKYFIGEQTEVLCIEVVSYNGNQLRYVKNQTPAICLAAVKQNGLALQDVDHQTVEVCEAAIKQNGQALFYVRNKTLALSIMALNSNYMSLAYIEDLESVVDYVTDEMIEKGLNPMVSFDVQTAYRKLIKIKESLNIANKITAATEKIETKKPGLIQVKKTRL